MSRGRLASMLLPLVDRMLWMLRWIGCFGFLGGLDPLDASLVLDYL